MMRKIRPLIVALWVFLFFSSNAFASTIIPVQITCYVDNESARDMLPLINEWRQSGGVWYWNEGNTNKIQCGVLPAYKYDYNLEQVALQRAYEIAISFEHTRPDGSLPWTCLYNGTQSYGECIAVGNSTTAATFEQWKEEDQKYEGQGHRRLMASSDYTCIGMAHVEYNGAHFWVQEYGTRNSGAASTPVVKGNVTGTVNIDVSRASFSLALENTFSSMELYSTRQLPTVVGSFRFARTWGNIGATVDGKDLSDLKWVSGDTSVLVIEDNKVRAVGAGSGTLTATVTFEGKSYSRSMNVNVSKVSLSSSALSVTVPICPYDINGAEPKPVIKLSGKKLVEGKDYTITGYANNKKVGTDAYMTVEGKGSFTGTVYIGFEIARCDIDSCTLSDIPGVAYTGSAVTPEIKLMQNGTALTKGAHYTVSYSDNINAGTATVTITGKGYYTGTKTASFTIKRRSVSNATVNMLTTMAYTGKAVTPKVTVKIDDRTLVKGTDYTVAYSNNINAGTATATISGKGNYSGTVALNFDIVDDIVISRHPKDYTGAAGSTAEFKVIAQGAGLKYQWQTNISGTWVNSSLPGSRTSTLSVDVTRSRNGYKFRCVVTDDRNRTAVSNEAVLQVLTPVKITTQPKDYTGTVGSTASFKITAQGTGLKYQWQTYKNGAWVNSTMPGAKTAVLSVDITRSRDGYKFRCVITDAGKNTVTSNTAVLHAVVPVTLAITTQPKNYSGPVGSTAQFKVKAQGTGLKYQWQTYKNGQWVNSSLPGSKTAVLSVDVTRSRDGYKFRCVITDAGNKKVTSNTVTLTVRSGSLLLG